MTSYVHMEGRLEVGSVGHVPARRLVRAPVTRSEAEQAMEVANINDITRNQRSSIALRSDQFIHVYGVVAPFTRPVSSSKNTKSPLTT